MSYEKKCPKCQETLNIDARVCGCGWTADGKRGDKGPLWAHVCRWQFGALKCKNPVGLFAHGETSGLCVFHRAITSGPTSAEIARDSELHDQESYNIAAARQTYGGGDNPTVRRMRDEIAASGKTKRGGSFSNMEYWIALCKSRGTQQREAA